MLSRVFIASALVLGMMGLPFALEVNAPEGSASFGFLKLSLSPRSVGLGGAGAGLVSGIADADLNPAAAARDSGGIAFGQTYLSSVSATGSFAEWNIPWDKRRITVQVRYLGYDNIPGYSESNQSTADYGAHTIKMQAGTAGNALGFDYGASAAFAQNNIDDKTYAAGLLNLGLWRSFPQGMSAGLSVMNADFWISKATDGSAIIAPTVFQGGVAYSHTLLGNLQVSGAVDARKPNDEEMSLPIGVEAIWQHVLSVRLGHQDLREMRLYHSSEFSTAATTLGLGLQWSRYGVEYAYQGNTALTDLLGLPKSITAPSHIWALEIRY